MAGPLLKDANWVRQSFLVKREELDKVDQQNRIFSTASLKFTDTSPGGNFAINPPPQFTRFADIRQPGRFVRNTAQNPGSGMGRYYSEAFDDNQQIINMRFGVPQFNSLTTFFTGFYNTGAGQLARTGRATGAFYNLGRAAAFVVSVMSWPLLAIHAIGVGLRFALEKPSSKFYYLKPAMPLYWNAVNTIVNHMSVNMGIVPRVFGTDTEGVNPGYANFDKDALAKLNEILPDIFNKDGGIDVYAMANRAQRLEVRAMERYQQEIGDGPALSEAQFSAKIQQLNTEKLSDNGGMGYKKYLDSWLSTSSSDPNVNSGMGMETMPAEKDKKQSFFSRLGEFLSAEMYDGSAFASFRVNSTGSVNESFSNSVTESEIASKINSMSSQSRSSSFNFANFNIADVPVIGSMVGAVKDFASGAMDQLQISGLAALGGAAFVDIPKHWQSSQASLPRANYTINLVSPYGNPISQLINIHIPLAMLLAGALPLSTGKQSYTSPFILELYDRGRCQTRLGMIDSLSITRGTGNMGFNNDGKVMAVEVSFSVVDLSSIMHMPISEGMSFSKMVLGAAAGALGGAGVVGGAAVGNAAGTAAATVLGGGATAVAATGAVAAGGVGLVGGVAAVGAALGVFDEDTTFSDYMAVLTGLGLADQIYVLRKAKLNLTRTMRTWDTHFSLSHFANWFGDTPPARLVSAFYRGTARN